MFNQPSVNQLAQTFLGNPAPLQAKVQQEQQAAPNLPPDLAQLMALQQIQETRDAAQRQQAMSQGTPPTVAQQLQQAAQPQQPQQGVTLEMIARMMQRPRQAGIDQLPSNFGQGMAGGGIVAFDEGGDTNKNETSEERRDRMIREALLSQIPGSSVQAPQGGERVEGSEFTRNLANTLSSLPGAGAVKGFAGGARGLAALLGGMLGGDRFGIQEERQPAPASVATAMQSAAPIASGTPNLPVTPDQVVPPSRPGIDQLPTAVPRPSRVPVAPTSQPAAPATPSSAEQIFAKGMALDPEERQRRAEAGLQAIGGPDQEAQKRYIAELEARRAQFKKPEAGYAGLMDLLGNIAQSKGRTWMAAGAEGVQRQKENEAAMAQKDIETLKEIMGETTKMGEAGRQFKLATYAAGQKAYDEAYKDRLEAAKAQGLTDNEAKRLAQQAAEHAKTLASKENIAKLSRDAAAARAAQLSPEAALAEQKEAAWLKLNPNKTPMDYLREAASARQGTAPQSKQAALVEKYSKDWLAMPYIEKSKLEDRGITEDAWIRSKMKLSGLDLPASSAAPAGNTMTMADVQTTAANSGKTVQEVIAAAKAKGISVQ